MKKVILFLAAIMIFSVSSVAFAGELEEAKLQMQNIQLEFSYITERQKVLQFEGKALSEKIQAMEADKKKTKTEAKIQVMEAGKKKTKAEANQKDK